MLNPGVLYMVIIGLRVIILKMVDPITIIKNGQPTDASSSEGYLPITEDINNDPIVYIFNFYPKNTI